MGMAFSTQLAKIGTAFVLSMLVIFSISYMSEARAFETSVHTYGDDLIPWPWGSECPFPWREIEGTFMVKKGKGGPYSGHVMEFTVIESPKDGVNYLEINEYDSKGKPYASGKGFTQKDKRLVRGLLTTADGSRKYTVIVRSYVRSENAKCADSDLALVAAFCPLRGKKCLDDSNYELVKHGNNIRR